MRKTIVIFLTLLVTFATQAAAQANTAEQRAVLVTGASSGIGKRIALTLAEQGFFVYAGARKAEDIETLSGFDNIQGIRLDVTRQEEIDAAVVTVRKAGCGLYGLVNNAGVFLFDPMIEVSERDMQFIFDVNVFGPYRVTQAFAPLLIESQGRITTTGSIASAYAGRLFGPYSMTKAAMASFTEALSSEMRKFGVAVSIVDPGNFQSDIMQNMQRRMAALKSGERSSQFEEEIARLATFTKVDRSQQADAAPVADAVVHFLTSEQPKLRYMVTPNQREATMTIRSTLKRAVQLNEDQAYSLSRDEIVTVLDKLLAQTGRAMTGWIERLTLVRPEERLATALSFLMAFVLMAAYLVLRPVRDAMASDWSDAELSLLWNLQLVLSTGLVALYSLAVSRWSLKRIVPGVYTVFALSFLGFWQATPLVEDAKLLDQAFYLWVAAFSLFNLSVFWSFMSNTFDADQGRRLFAIIASGASAGAIVGPAIPALFADALGLDRLMLIAAIGVLLVVPVILVLQRLASSNGSSPVGKEPAVDLRWWSGFRDVVSNPYLRAIGLFILLYVFVGSFVYFIQKNLLADFTRVERTQILGSVSWLVNSLTFGCALLVTGRLVSRAGMVLTLASVPLLLLVGMAAIALAPLVVVLLSVDTLRRVGNYAVTRPAREMLFSRVTADQRFKAKQVLDVVVYRGGDAASGSVFALLSEGLGLALPVMAMVGSGVAGLWSVVAVYLGRRYQRTDKSPQADQEPHKNSAALVAAQT